MADATDLILVEGLKISCVVGIHPWERVAQQPLIIDLEITTDVRKAAASEGIEDTVDYASACELSADIAREGRYQLIETLASELAEAILALPKTLAVAVTIRKPHAVKQARNVAVRISRP